ncbi:hypothetical protein Bbelb_236640 [Branchiostoma belcheri]|nr:hypothetical protein Bbelb_236640 [Branchiostoma belcheri]
MRPRGTICCRGSFCTERETFSPWQKLPRQQIVPRGRILLASLREKITPTPNKTAKEARESSRVHWSVDQDKNEKTGFLDLSPSRETKVDWEKLGEDRGCLKLPGWQILGDPRNLVKAQRFLDLSPSRETEVDWEKLGDDRGSQARTQIDNDYSHFVKFKHQVKEAKKLNTKLSTCTTINTRKKLQLTMDIPSLTLSKARERCVWVEVANRVPALVYRRVQKWRYPWRPLTSPLGGTDGSGAT